MFCEHMKELVMSSLDLMAVDIEDLEQVLIERTATKMELRCLHLHFDQKLLIMAVAAYVRSLVLDKNNRQQDEILKSYKGLLNAVKCNETVLLSTGIFFLSQIREMLGEDDDELIINAWGELFSYVHGELSNVEDYQNNFSENV